MNRNASFGLKALGGLVLVASSLGNAPYQTPTLGAAGTPTVDGANTQGEWGPQNLIAQGLANDDPRSLGNNWSMHETPWDLTHLYAAWDDENLYLAWQYVDVTDVLDPANAGSAGGTSPRQMDLIQWIALDTGPGGAALDMWGKNGGEPYWTGTDLPDHQIYLASNLWQGFISTAVDGVFPVDDDGVNYHAVAAVGIQSSVGAGFAAATLPGVDDADQALTATPRDFLAASHNTSRDTFYELKVPLAALGLTRAQLERQGLGVMIGQGEGSCMDTLPHDPATMDTVGVSNTNSPLEWSDVDSFTVPFARVGSAGGAPQPDPDAGLPDPDAGEPSDSTVPSPDTSLRVDAVVDTPDAHLVDARAPTDDASPPQDGGVIATRDAEVDADADAASEDGCSARPSGLTGGGAALAGLLLLAALRRRKD